MCSFAQFTKKVGIVVWSEHMAARLLVARIALWPEQSPQRHHHSDHRENGEDVEHGDTP